jgi:hypothetical protein
MWFATRSGSAAPADYLRRQRGVRFGARFCPRLRCIGKAHGGAGGSCDFLVGQVEPRRAVALHPIATVSRKDPQLVAIMGHRSSVLPRAVDSLSTPRKESALKVAPCLVDGGDPVRSRLSRRQVSPGGRQLGHFRLAFVEPNFKKPDDLAKLGIRKFVEEGVGTFPGGHRKNSMSRSCGMESARPKDLGRIPVSSEPLSALTSARRPVYETEGHWFESSRAHTR